MKVSTRVWRADPTAAGGVGSIRPPSWVSELDTDGCAEFPSEVMSKAFVNPVKKCVRETSHREELAQPPEHV